MVVVYLYAAAWAFINPGLLATWTCKMCACTITVSTLNLCALQGHSYRKTHMHHNAPDACTSVYCEFKSRAGQHFLPKYPNYFSYMLKDTILHKFWGATDSWTQWKQKCLAVILHNHTEDQSSAAAFQTTVADCKLWKPGGALSLAHSGYVPTNWQQWFVQLLHLRKSLIC